MGGFGCKVPLEKFEEFNLERQRQALEPLTEQAGLRLIDPQRAKHGTWKIEHMIAQVGELHALLNFAYPQFQHFFEVDNSANHGAHKPDGLSITGINVGYGGEQRDLRDTVLTAGCIGPHPAVFTHVTEEGEEATVDPKLKVGDTQCRHFKEEDLPPYYEMAKADQCHMEGQKFAPREDVVIEGVTMKKRGRKRGEEVAELQKVIPGYVGKQKGKRHYAWETGWIDPAKKMVESVKYNDPERGQDCSIDAALMKREDFQNEVTALGELIRSCGGVLKMSPKGHCELAGAGIEYCFGKSKTHFRRNKKARTIPNFESLVLESLSGEVLPLDRIRRFDRKARTYRRIYETPTLNYEAIEKMYRSRKAHRCALDFDFKFIKEN